MDIVELVGRQSDAVLVYRPENGHDIHITTVSLSIVSLSIVRLIDIHWYRFAFSVIWEMTSSGQIVNVEFCKSIIHSVAGLTYNEAQLMLDDPNIHDTKAQSVRQLNGLAKIFRQRRMDAGALTLASPEVSTC